MSERLGNLHVFPTGEVRGKECCAYVDGGIEEKVTVFVAGNPDLFPLEYYDKATGTFRGMIPELLEDFSEQNGYKIEYYLPGKKDLRKKLAENQQVDILSGCVSGESFLHTRKDAVVVLKSRREGEPISYQLWVTDVAYPELLEDLNTFFAGVDQETLTELMVEATGERWEMPGWVMPTVAGLSLAVAALAGVIALKVLKKYRRTGRKQRREKKKPKPDILSLETLRELYPQAISENTRVLYCAVYVHVEAGPLVWAQGQNVSATFLKRLRETFRYTLKDTDIFAQVCENGFLLLRQSGSRKELEGWLTSALEHLTFNDKVEEHDPEIYAGVYPLKNTDDDVEDILKKARQAVGQALGQNQPWQIFDSALQKRLNQEKEYRWDIIRGLEQEEFLLYVQFFMDAKTRKIVGGETLARWQHPQQGFLLPGRFVPVFERADMIDLLDFYILDKAAAFLEEICKEQTESFFLSCNFSRKTFAAEDFTERCKEILKRYQFPRERLMLEMTGSASVKETKLLKCNAQAMREYGVQIILDDFGHGFTSFFDLKDYRIDGLKLDRSLIRHLGAVEGEAILGSMIQVGHELKLTVLATGVEEEGQALCLNRLGCDAFQGYGFCRPLPHWEAERRLSVQEKERRECAL